MLARKLMHPIAITLTLSSALPAIACDRDRVDRFADRPFSNTAHARRVLPRTGVRLNQGRGS